MTDPEQRSIRERFEETLHDASRPIVLPPEQPRLTRLSADLWIDLGAIESVQTYTDPVSYNRMVKLRTYSGDVRTVTAVRVQVQSSVTANDIALADWLRDNLGSILQRSAAEYPDPQEQPR